MLAVLLMFHNIKHKSIMLQNMLKKIVQYSQTSSANRLPEQTKNLINQERASMSRISSAISRTNFKELKEDSPLIDFSSRTLDDYFLAMVTGPFNVGKSAFINKLIGNDVLKTGVVPTTDMINHIRYSSTPTTDEVNGEMITTVNAKWLENISIIDSPGIDSIFDEHEEKTRQFVRLSDMIFFLTSSAQTFSRTERAFLEYCLSRQKPVVILITKKDLLSTDELKEVREFLTTQFESRFKHKPEVMEISSKLVGTNEYDKSGFSAVKFYVQNRLNDVERIKIKLDNGAKMGIMMATKYSAMCEDECTKITEGIREVYHLEVQEKQYRDELTKYMELNYGDIHSCMATMRKRSRVMIDNNVRITNFAALFNRSTFADRFKIEVVDPTHQELERKIFYMTDYSDSKHRFFLETVKQRLASRFERIQGLVYNPDVGKKELADKSVSEVYNRMKSPSVLANEISTAVWNSVAIEMAAVFGWGAAAAYIPAAFLPFDPIVIPALGITTAAAGFALLPYKRNSINSSVDKKSHEAEEQLRCILETHFTNEIHKNTSTIQAVIYPHRKILEDRLTHLKGIHSDLKSEEKVLKDIREQISRLS
jgi:ribosome biogenesis GTPase A